MIFKIQSLESGVRIVRLMGCLTLLPTSAFAQNAPPTASVHLTDSSSAPLNGSTSFPALARDNEGDFTAVNVDVTTPTGASVAFAYYAFNGTDAQEFTFGNGSYGLHLNQLGTYTIRVKAADYSQGYERWSPTAQTTVNVAGSVN